MVENSPAGTLRLQALETARQELGECLVAEAAAEARFAAAESAIWQRRDAAAEVSDDDSAVEDFAAWLPQGRRQLATAQAMLERAAAETARARAIVAHMMPAGHGREEIPPAQA